MEINKLKRLLAEGNPDKQLDNIIENLSEDSKIPFDRQIHRVDAKEGTEQETAAKLKQLQINASQYGKNMPPAVAQEIKELQATLKNKEAQTNIARSFVKETIKDKNNNQKDALTGEKLKEGVEKMKLETIKFGNRVESAPKLNEEIKKNENNKEDNLMNKEQKAIFEQSMNDIFKILKEEDEEMTEEEIAVGEMPAVESPEVELPVEEEVVEVMPGQEIVQAEEPVLEPKLAANDAELAGAIPSEEVMEVQPEMAEEVAPESQTIEVPKDVEPVVEISDNSITITIPVSNKEGVATEFLPEEQEALEESFRTVYRSLSPRTLSEEESVEVPSDAEANVKFEDGKLVIEISTGETPSEEITQDQADALNEAIAVISYILKEEIEISKTEEQQYRVEEEIAPSDAPHPVVKSEIKSGEIVVQPHDHADAEGKKVRDAIIQEDELPAELEANTYDDPLDGNKIPEALEDGSEEETVELSKNVEADVNVDGENQIIRIEIPLANDSEKMSEVDEEGMEGLEEAFKFIYSLTTLKLNEDNSVTLPDNIEAEVLFENGNIVIQIPVDSPKNEFSDQETLELQEAINFISFILAEGVILSEQVEYLNEQPSRVLSVMPDGGGVAAGTAAVEAANPGYLGFLGNVAGGFAKPFQAVGRGIGGVGQFLGANPMIGTGLGLAGGIGALGLAGYGLGTKAGRKYLQKRFGLTKAGRQYQDLTSAERDALNLKTSAQLQNVAKAESDYAQKDSSRKAAEMQARKGSTFLNRFMSKTPLAGLGNTKIGRFFLNQDLKDKMEANKKGIIDKYNDPNSQEFRDLDARGLKYKYDPKTKRHYAVDKTTGDINIDSTVGLMGSLRKADDFTTAVSDVESNYAKTKEQNAAQRQLDMDARETAINTAKSQMDRDKIEFDANDEARWAKSKALTVAESINERFYFDVDSAYSILEGRDFTHDEKLDIISVAYSNLFLEDTKELILESGYNTSEKGVLLFLESKNVDLSIEEKGDLVKSLNSDETKKEFEKHYQSKRHLDIKSDDITNKDMETGMKANDVKPVIVESVDKPHSKEVNHSGSDTIDSDGGLAKDEKASEDKVEDIVKAEPKDVTEAVQYKSLKEAFLLENGYFEKDSVSVISPADKKSKLLNQLGLLVARDVQDPLYEELLKTTAHAKQLQEELQGKYKAVALKKAGQLLEYKKSVNETPQFSYDSTKPESKGIIHSDEQFEKMKTSMPKGVSSLYVDDETADSLKNKGIKVPGSKGGQFTSVPKEKITDYRDKPVNK